MSGALVMIKTALLKQIRSYRFLVVVAASIAFAWLCVPTAEENYNVFIIGGTMRGLYNSAYLGAIASAASSIVLFLAGFFLLRSQISEDRNLRIGQIIAAKSISKLRYVCSKAVSNLMILLCWEAVFLLSIVVMQFIRAEDMNIVPMDFITPFLELTLPYLIVLAALTVLFDTLPLMKGVLGNVVFITLWTMTIILPDSYPGRPVFDMLGSVRIADSLALGAAASHPEIPPEMQDSVSFGLNYYTRGQTTFVWEGLSPDSAFVASRFIWIGIAIALTIIAALVFDRFKGNKNLTIPVKKTKTEPGENASARVRSNTLRFPPVSRLRSGNMPGLIRGELRIMLSELSWLQIILILTGIGLNLFLPREYISGWLGLFLTLTTSVLAGMGCRDFRNRTRPFILTRCDLRDKWLAEGISGFLVALMAVSGVLLRGVISGSWLQVVSCLVGAFFVASLALTLGTVTKSHRFFEAVYLMWVYIGPVQQIPALNFLSDSSAVITVYGIMGIALTAIGYFVVSAQEKGLSITLRRKHA